MKYIFYLFVIFLVILVLVAIIAIIYYSIRLALARLSLFAPRASIMKFYRYVTLDNLFIDLPFEQASRRSEQIIIPLGIFLILISFACGAMAAYYLINYKCR